MIYVKQSSNEEKIRVKPLTREIAESVWFNQLMKMEKRNQKTKIYSIKFLMTLKLTLIEQVLTDPPPPTPQKKDNKIG